MKVLNTFDFSQQLQSTAFEEFILAYKRNFASEMLILETELVAFLCQLLLRVITHI
jgi:hypothetical protein